MQPLQTLTGTVPYTKITHLDESPLLRAAPPDTRPSETPPGTISRKLNTLVRVRKETPQIATEWLVGVSALPERINNLDQKKFAVMRELILKYPIEITGSHF